MKLQILNQAQQSIVGYETLTIERNQMNLSHITNNECEFILASDIFDSFPAGSAEELINGLLSKLRLRGELVVGGTDVRLFAKVVSNGLVSELDASNIVTNVHSMTTSGQIREILEQRGLEILSVHLDGVHYEIKARRVR